MGVCLQFPRSFGKGPNKTLSAPVLQERQSGDAGDGELVMVRMQQR